MNKGKEADGIITKLYYNNGKDYVQDFSYFTNQEYMSNELLEALRYGQTLTNKLEKELRCFVIEASVN